MRTQTKATNMTLTTSVEGYVEKKITSLRKLIDENDDSALLMIEVAKTSEHHHKGDVFRAEFNLHTKDGDFFAEATRQDIFTALDEVKDGLVDAVRTRKDKKFRLIRKGQLRVKEIIRGFTNK